MKIVTLNVWGGRKQPCIADMIENNRDIGIYCFQEVYDNAHGKETLFNDGTNLDCFHDLMDKLPQYRPYYDPHLQDWWGLALFVSKDLPLVRQGEVYVHKMPGFDIETERTGRTAKNVQFVETLLPNGETLTVCNFHGLWNGLGKIDTPERVEQSKKIVEFVRSLKGHVVLCGDFNLSPDTESLKMIPRELGFRDLVHEYGITSTRTHLYPKEGKFADYVFVSPRLSVKDFIVMPDVVSDHAPLLLEIEE